MMLEQKNERETNHYHSHRKSDLNRMRKILRMIVGNWYYVIFSLIIAIGLAFFYNYKTIPTYLVSSAILIEEGSNNAVPETDRLLQGFGLQPGAQNLQNQMQILSSWTLIRNTLEELDFGIDVYRKGLTKKASFYPNDPIHVEIMPESRIPYNLNFTIKLISEFEYKISVEKNDYFELDTVVRFWDKIQMDGYAFYIYPIRENWDQLDIKKR